MTTQTAPTNTSLPLGIAPNYKHLEDRLSRLEAERLEHVIQRLIIREGVKEEIARQLRIEFLRFFSLSFVTDEQISPSPQVDEFWHAFILFTEDYHRFCEEHYGTYFHHSPRDHSQTKQPTDGTPGMRTKQLIEDMYPDHDTDVWAETAICSVSHCDRGDTIKRAP